MTRFNVRFHCTIVVNCQSISLLFDLQNITWNSLEQIKEFFPHHYLLTANSWFFFFLLLSLSASLCLSFMVFIFALFFFFLIRLEKLRMIEIERGREEDEKHEREDTIFHAHFSMCFLYLSDSILKLFCLSFFSLFPRLSFSTYFVSLKILCKCTRHCRCNTATVTRKHIKSQTQIKLLAFYCFLWLCDQPTDRLRCDSYFSHYTVLVFFCLLV